MPPLIAQSLTGVLRKQNVGLEKEVVLAKVMGIEKLRSVEKTRGGVDESSTGE